MKLNEFISNLEYLYNYTLYTNHTNKNINLKYEINTFVKIKNFSFDDEKLSLENLFIDDLNLLSLIKKEQLEITLDDIVHILNSLEKYLFEKLKKCLRYLFPSESEMINSEKLFIVNTLIVEKIRKNSIKEKSIFLLDELFFTVIKLIVNYEIGHVFKYENLQTLNNTIDDFIELYKTENLDKEIIHLTNKLKKLELSNEQNKGKLESERLEKEKLIKTLKLKNKQFGEELEKQINSKRINEAIEKLRIPSNVLIEEKENFRKNRNSFFNHAMEMFKISIIIFFFVLFYLFFILDINIISENSNFGFYLLHSFPFLFPTILGFLFLRQSNLNSKELDKINNKFTLIHDINQSLLALNEINDDKEMNKKTKLIIDKLIESILYSDNKDINKNLEYEKVNKSIDDFIDTINKKKSIIKDTLTSNNT